VALKVLIFYKDSESNCTIVINITLKLLVEKYLDQSTTSVTLHYIGPDTGRADVVRSFTVWSNAKTMLK
jgi:hypothetical protein